MKDYYYILGVAQNATQEEIKAAYRKLSIKFHPDKNEGDAFFEERFKDIWEAYDVLRNPSTRSSYDFRFRSSDGRDPYKDARDQEARRKREEELRKREQELKEREEVLKKQANHSTVNHHHENVYQSVKKDAVKGATFAKNKSENIVRSGRSLLSRILSSRKWYYVIMGLGSYMLSYWRNEYKYYKVHQIDFWSEVGAGLIGLLGAAAVLACIFIGIRWAIRRVLKRKNSKETNFAKIMFVCWLLVMLMPLITFFQPNKKTTSQSQGSYSTKPKSYDYEKAEVHSQNSTTKTSTKETPNYSQTKTVATEQSEALVGIRPRAKTENEVHIPILEAEKRSANRHGSKDKLASYPQMKNQGKPKSSPSKTDKIAPIILNIPNVLSGSELSKNSKRLIQEHQNKNQEKTIDYIEIECRKSDQDTFSNRLEQIAHNKITTRSVKTYLSNWAIDKAKIERKEYKNIEIGSTRLKFYYK